MTTEFVIPEGYTPVKWNDVCKGQVVYICGTYDGRPMAYGPHAVYDYKDKRLINKRGVSYTHYAEDLLVPVLGNEKTYIEPGEFGIKLMGYSEVCMHMKISGHPFQLRLNGPDRNFSVQLFYGPHEFSGSITYGEAGLHREGDRFYYYPNDSGGPVQY